MDLFKKYHRISRSNYPFKININLKSEGFIKWLTLAFSVVAIVISYFALQNSVDSKKISNRPYVIVEEIIYSFGTPSLEKGNSVDNFEVEILVKNVGQTPAYKTEIKSAINIYGPNFTNLPKFSDEIETEKVLVNGSTYYIKIKNITPFSIEKINDVNDRVSYIYAYGIISYEDIFNDCHATKFCFRMEFLGFDGFKFFRMFNVAN